MTLLGCKSGFQASGIRLWRPQPFAARIDGGIEAGPFKGVVTIALNQ